jgi:hypothetical protein
MQKTSIKQRWDSNFNINFKVKVKQTGKCIVLALAIFTAAPGLPQWKFYGAHNFLCASIKKTGNTNKLLKLSTTCTVEVISRTLDNFAFCI